METWLKTCRPFDYIVKHKTWFWIKVSWKTFHWFNLEPQYFLMKISVATLVYEFHIWCKEMNTLFWIKMPWKSPKVKQSLLLKYGVFVVLTTNLCYSCLLLQILQFLQSLLSHIALTQNNGIFSCFKVQMVYPY